MPQNDRQPSRPSSRDSRGHGAPGNEDIPAWQKTIVEVPIDKTELPPTKLDARRTFVEPPPPKPEPEPEPDWRRTMVELPEDQAALLAAHMDARRTSVEPPMPAGYAGSQDAPAKPPKPDAEPDWRRTMVELPDNLAEIVAGRASVPVVKKAETDGPVPAAPVSKAPTREARPSKTAPAVPKLSKVEAQKFQPSKRPPMARLAVLDDSGTDAEVVRIRTEKFRIGRVSGDFVIPHDDRMSGEHVLIRRYNKGGKWVWVIKDLNSTNGLFVRVEAAPLVHMQEFILGQRTYRFECSNAFSDPSCSNDAEDVPAEKTWVDDAPPEPNADDPSKNRNSPYSPTMVHQAEPEKGFTAASFVDLEDGQRYPLRNLQWLGRDPLLDQIGLNDLFTGNREARIYQENDGNWFIKRGESLNGLWVRVPSVAIHERGSQFQCGEQRFEFRMA